MAPLPRRRERILVGALCAVAAIRVLVFSAAFPLFDNVDEKSHFDVVYRYSRGDLPRGLEPKSAGAVRIIRYCETWEYLSAPEKYEEGRTPPPGWTVGPEVLRIALDRAVADEARVTNAESTQPPLYYLVAGAWYRLGQLLGLRQGFGAYWIRFLNVPLVALIVWVVHLVARALAPGEAAIRLGAPLLAAFLPQDAFFSIGNDVLSPLTAGLAFFALLSIGARATGGMGIHALAGLAVSASLLTKLTNLPILAIAAAVAAIELIAARRRGELPAVWPRVVLLASTIALPAGAWALRNYVLMGDFTGMAQKAARLGWTPKPAAELLHHPIFTPAGSWQFLGFVLASFWRGEFTWHGTPLAWGGVDLFYAASSLLLVGVAAAAAFARGPAESCGERFGIRAGLGLVVLSILLLAWGSIAYDFGRCRYPSTEFPYIASGRLIGGAMAPFLCLYAIGLKRLLSRLGAGRAALPLLILLALAMVSMEVVLSLDVFGSRFNWFHMVAP